ncbi:MAG: radical SAM protein [Candidatus Omnitrophica bacterium]|nr:radical SAM protein [Candidatus Omnitrophota bacterium]
MNILDAKYPLKSIYFYISGACNMNCKHCWIEPDFDDFSKASFLDLELFSDILEQAKPLGLVSIKLTGGEPLLHPKIFEILDIIKKYDLRLIIETNGTFCTEAIAKKNFRV